MQVYGKIAQIDDTVKRNKDFIGIIITQLE